MSSGGGRGDDPPYLATGATCRPGLGVTLCGTECSAWHRFKPQQHGPTGGSWSIDLLSRPLPAVLVAEAAEEGRGAPFSTICDEIRPSSHHLRSVTPGGGGGSWRPRPGWVRQAYTMNPCFWWPELGREGGWLEAHPVDRWLEPGSLTLSLILLWTSSTKVVGWEEEEGHFGASEGPLEEDGVNRRHSGRSSVVWLVGVREREKGVAAGWSEEAAAVMGLGRSPAAPAQPSSEGS